AVALAGDEHVVRAVAPREHLWRVRQHHAYAVRDLLRGSSRRTGLAGIRVQGQTRGSVPMVAADCSVSPATRLGDVVRGVFASGPEGVDRGAAAASARGRRANPFAAENEPLSESRAAFS